MIFACAIILSLFVGNSLIFVKDFKDSTVQYQKVKNDNLNLIKSNSENLWRLTFTDQKLIYPPAILGFISEAYEKNLPNGIKINFFTTSTPEFFKKESLFFYDSETMDWNNILILFVSFICIFFSYDAFSGEKAMGTLKLMISNSIPRSHIVLGKYLGVIVVVFLPFLLGTLISTFIFLISSVIQLSWNHLLSIIFYLIASGLFISLNVCIGLLISTLTSKPIISLSFVIMIWLFFSIVIPGMGWVVAKKKISIESLNAINNKLQLEMKALGSSQWNGNWTTPTADVYKNKDHFDQQTEITNRTWNNFRGKLFEQTKKGILISEISPFQTFRFLGEKIADNGFFRYKNFYNQVNNYHQIYRDFIYNEDRNDQNSYHLIWSMEYYTMKFMSNKPVSYEKVPKFEYTPPSFLQRIDNLKIELIILMSWNVILLSFIFYSFNRYDVR